MNDAQTIADNMMDVGEGLFAFLQAHPWFQPAIAIGSTLLFSLVAYAFVTFSLDKLSKKSAKNCTQIIFFKHIVNGIIIAFAVFNVMVQIGPFQKLALSIAAGSSVIAVAVAFASQEAMTNVISGFFLTVFKPFKTGDRIKLADKNIVGFIEEITMRHTVIRTFEHSRVVVPNSVMNTSVVENFDLITGNICTFLEISIGYGSNIDQAIRIISEQAKAHPDFQDVRTEAEKRDGVPAIITRVVGLGTSSVDLKATLWAKDAATAFSLCCDLRKGIKEAFDREGVEIPFTQVVIHNS